jgi:hypothetical protein
VLTERSTPFAYASRDAAARAARLDGFSGTPAFFVGRTGGSIQPLAANDIGSIRTAVDSLLTS